MAKTYEEALQEARAALADIKERGEEAISGDWDELRNELFTPEEIAESDLRVALVEMFIKARNAGITLNKMEEISNDFFNETRELMANA